MAPRVGRHRIQRTVPAGDEPVGLAFADDALWVTNQRDGLVRRMNIWSGQSGVVLDVGRPVEGAEAAGDRVYVAARYTSTRVSRSAGPPSLGDSRAMTCILLDVDGVLHVSGEAIPGAPDAVARLRAAGHTLRFVTNTSTRPRAQLTAELRELGFELSEDELQTTARTAARELAGKRVFALVMSNVVPDLEGLELVGEGAEAVLIGGCDETLEPNQVFSYMNLARAFAEIQLGADFYCLHKNRWWQTSRGPLLDAGAFVAGLEYATGVEATVLGKPSPQYFAAALDALGAEPELTWLVGDDAEADVRAAQLFGMRTALVRTGKFRPDTLERLDVTPDVVLSSIADLPDWLDRAR
jgi:HAD superfamily hydrolase (TIGR01458 family)